MKAITKVLILFLILNTLACKDSSQKTETKKNSTEFNVSKVEKNQFPKSSGIITDNSYLFTKSQRTELSKLLYDYEIVTTRQIIIVTVDSIKPYNNVQKYATDLANAWGVGTAEKNNGLTIVICNYCREVGIATGYKTAHILTDEICKEVIENTIIPEFKNEDFYSGTKKGVTKLIEKWE